MGAAVGKKEEEERLSRIEPVGQTSKTEPPTVVGKPEWAELASSSRGRTVREGGKLEQGEDIEISDEGNERRSCQRRREER